MSIKRTKQVSYGRGRRDEDDASFGGAADKAAAPEKSWAEHVQGQADDAFAHYSLTQRFDKGGLLAHPTFGRGVVLGVDGRRIEVLFEAGKKTLAHGA